MLFNLLFVTKAILLCFLSFFALFLKAFLSILLLIKNTKLRLALVIPTGAPMKIAN